MYALAVVENKYDHGAADIVVLVNTQSALADAQQQRIESPDEWRSSRLTLLVSVGQLNRATVTQEGANHYQDSINSVIVNSQTKTLYLFN
jgi:outer membrane protein TolC